MYRARRAEARIQQMLWKINYSDIVFVNTVRVARSRLALHWKAEAKVKRVFLRTGTEAKNGSAVVRTVMSLKQVHLSSKSVIQSCNGYFVKPNTTQNVCNPLKLLHDLTQSVIDTRLYQTIIIIINNNNNWLVLEWTLPFPRATSMPVEWTMQ